MQWREECDILFRKAAQDELAMNKLAPDREVANEIIGFVFSRVAAIVLSPGRRPKGQALGIG